MHAKNTTGKARASNGSIGFRSHPRRTLATTPSLVPPAPQLPYIYICHIHSAVSFTGSLSLNVNAVFSSYTQRNHISTRTPSLPDRHALIKSATRML
jgi:hypothetical protein